LATTGDHCGGACTVRSLIRKLYDYLRYQREFDYTSVPNAPNTAAGMSKAWQNRWVPTVPTGFPRTPARTL